MHIEYIDEKSFKIFLYDDKKIENFNKNNDNASFFKKIFLILKNKYYIKLSGLYKIDIFICNNYGIVIELNHEEDELFDDYIDGVDLKIKINDTCETLFQIDDVLLVKNEDNIQIFKNNNKYYIMFINKPSKKQLYKILEHSKIIYGKMTKKIINPYNIFKI